MFGWLAAARVRRVRTRTSRILVAAAWRSGRPGGRAAVRQKHGLEPLVQDFAARCCCDVPRTAESVGYGERGAVGVRLRAIGVGGCR